MQSKHKSSRPKGSPKSSPSSENKHPESDAPSFQLQQGQVFYYLKEKAENRNDITIKQVRETLAKRKKIYDESKKDFESELRSLRIEVENFGNKLMNRINRAIKDRVNTLVNHARKYGEDELKAFVEVSDSFNGLLKAFEDSLFEERRNAGKSAKAHASSYFVNQELYNKFKVDSYEINVEFVSDQIVIPFDMANFGTLHFDGRPSDDQGLGDGRNDALGFSDDSNDSIIIETAKKRVYHKKRRRERSDGEESDDESCDETLEPGIKNLRTASPAPVVVSFLFMGLFYVFFFYLFAFY